MIPEIPSNDGEHLSDSIVCRSITQAPCLCSDAWRCFLGDRYRNRFSTCGAHVLQTRDRKLLVFREQILIAVTKTHHQGGHPVLVHRRFHFRDELPTRSHM
jgi:hypothetical protein